MRWVLAAVLAGCTAQAAPPFGGGGSVPQSGGDMIGTSSTLAQCQALTPAEGDLCFPTDSPYTMVARSAGTWSYRYPGIGFDVTLAPSSSWTAFNSGSVASSGGSRVLTVPASASVNWRGEYRAQPATPFFVKACMETTGTPGGGIIHALGGTDGTGLATVGHVQHSVGLGTESSAAWRLTNATTYAAADVEVRHAAGALQCYYYEDDGTDRNFGLIDPKDGTLVQLGGDYGRTVTITATSIGYYADAESASSALRVRLVHWATGTP